MSNIIEEIAWDKHRIDSISGSFDEFSVVSICRDTERKKRKAFASMLVVGYCCFCFDNLPSLATC